MPIFREIMEIFFFFTFFWHKQELMLLVPLTNGTTLFLDYVMVKQIFVGCPRRSFYRKMVSEF